MTVDINDLEPYVPESIQDRIDRLTGNLEAAEESIRGIHESRRGIIQMLMEALMAQAGIVPFETIVVRVRDATSWVVLDAERHPDGRPRLQCRRIKQDGTLGSSGEKLMWPADSGGRIKIEEGQRWQHEIPLS